MDDHGGPAIAEDGMIVGAERDVRGDDGGMCRAVSRHDQRKIRDVACRKPGVFAVLCAARVEVRIRQI